MRITSEIFQVRTVDYSGITLVNRYLTGTKNKIVNIFELDNQIGISLCKSIDSKIVELNGRSFEGNLSEFDFIKLRSALDHDLYFDISSVVSSVETLYTSLEGSSITSPI